MTEASTHKNSPAYGMSIGHSVSLCEVLPLSLLRETVNHLRDLPRYRQILASLVRYGYQDVVAALHLEGFVRPLERVALGSGIPPQDRARRLKLVCEDLGPTFVKLGQVLSTRPDLLPEAYTNELATLRDDVRPFAYSEVEEILLAEYERPASEVFASINSTQIASASISQVHKAVLPDGRVVVLKICRPGIHKIVQADLDILKNLAQLAERRLPFLAVYNPLLLVREFERTIKRELDFSIERRTMQRCSAMFANDSTVHIPFVVEEFSTSRVIAMEFIDGGRIDDLNGLRAMGIDPVELAKTGARLLLRMIFEFGFFHADPHPGNLRVLPGGVIAPLDYGMFGQLDLPTRELIAELLSGLLAQDTSRVMRALDALGIRNENADPKALRRDVGELVSTYSDLTLDTINLGQLLKDLVDVIRTHHLHIPPDFVLLIRSLVTIEGLCRTLDPHFDIARQLEPTLRMLALRRFRFSRLLNRSIRTAEDIQRISTLLPEVLSQSLESIRRGELNVKFDLQGFEGLIHQLIRASNTLAGGIVISGLFVSSSLVLRSGAPTLAIVGFVTALVMSVWLIWNMARK